MTTATAAGRVLRFVGRAAGAATTVVGLSASALGCGSSRDVIPHPPPPLTGVVVTQGVADAPRGRARVRLVVREANGHESTITRGVEALACDGGSRYPSCLVP